MKKILSLTFTLCENDSCYHTMALFNILHLFYKINSKHTQAHTLLVQYNKNSYNNCRNYTENKMKNKSRKK